MKTKNLILLALVVLALGIYIGLTQHEKRVAAKKDAANRLLAWPASDIASLSFLWGHEIFRLEQANKTWRYVKPSVLPADSEKISEFLEAVREISLGEPLALGDTADAYGLSEVTHWLRVVHGDGHERLIKLGAMHPLGNQQYVQIGQDPNAYLLDTSIFRRLDLGIEAFADHAVLHLDPWAATRIEQKRADGTGWTVEKHEGKWTLVAPRAVSADGTQVESLLSFFDDLKWKEPPTIAQEMPESVDYSYLIDIQESDPLSLYFSRDKDGVWEVQASNSAFRYRVPLDDKQRAFLESDVTDIHHKEVFTFFPWQVKAVDWEIDGVRNHWKNEGEAQWLAPWLKLTLRRFIALDRASWPEARRRYGLNPPLLQGVIHLEEENRIAKQQPFYYARRASHHYLLLFPSSDYTLDKVPENFELYEISENFLKFLQK